jgi:hypothetical protein
MRWLSGWRRGRERFEMTITYEIPTFFNRPTAPGSACNPDDTIKIIDSGLKTLEIQITGLKPLYITRRDFKRLTESEAHNDA